jgi:hypothetical protein
MSIWTSRKLGTESQEWKRIEVVRSMKSPIRSLHPMRLIRRQQSYIAVARDFRAPVEPE